MAYLNATAGTNRALLSIQAGSLSADATGRAMMASSYFNAATASAKFAANAIASDLLAARTLEAHTAGDTLTAAETGSVHTNTGAAGTITLILPAATVGLEFYFYVGAAQELRLDPNGTETISLPSTGVAGAAGKYLSADAVGETVHLLCGKAGTWSVMGYTGTWTAEG